jgi:transposase-like protein
MKGGNVSETCRRHGIAPNVFYRWKDEAEQDAKAAFGGRSAAAVELHGAGLRVRDRARSTRIGVISCGRSSKSMTVR